MSDQETKNITGIKIAFAVAGIVAGGLLLNGCSGQTTSHNITAQKGLETEIIAFSTAIQDALPPRNQALEAHRAIERKCSLPFVKPHAPKRLLSFAYRYNRAVLNCLETAENAAVSRDITYDYNFAKNTAATLRYNIERAR